MLMFDLGLNLVNVKILDIRYLKKKLSHFKMCLHEYAFISKPWCTVLVKIYDTLKLLKQTFWKKIFEFVLHEFYKL